MDPVVVPAVVGIGLVYAVAPAVAMQVVGAVGPRKVTCPDNGHEALVKLSLRRAAESVFTGANQEVCDCSRWPGKANCDHACMNHFNV